VLLSGSKYGLARCCLYWARADVPDLPRVENPDAKAGTNRHRALEALVNDTDGTASALWLASLWGCTVEEWPQVEANIMAWLPKGAPEVALYYHPATDTARSSDARDRAYQCEPGEVPMTVDLLRHQDGSPIEVWDYKTGRQDGLEPAASNAQLAICCLAAARMTGAAAARGVLAVVADDGTARLDAVELDSLDLDAIAYEVRGLLERIPTSEPAPGPWCSDKWCPARAVCPATRAAMVATPMEPMSIVVDSADACARIHTQIGLAEEFLETVKRARNEWLQNNPAGCELADGSVLQWTIEERDTIELTDAAAALIPPEAIERKTSKTAIERAIKATCAKGEAAAKMREVLAALDAAGAIKTSQYGKPKSRKAGRRAA